MRIYLLLDPKPRTDLGGILGKNLLVRNRLVRLTYKLARSVTAISSKVQKSKTYNEAISDLLHSNKWQEAVDKEL